MKSRQFMDETNVAPGWAGEKPTLRVVIVYDEPAAGKRAAQLMTSLGRGLGDEIEFQPIPWSFDLLFDASWTKEATSDAVRADILIIATTKSDPLPVTVSRWIKSAIFQKNGTHAAVVGLLGPGENPDASGSAGLAVLRDAAHQAGLDFFSSASSHGLDATSEPLQPSAECVSPRLRQSCQPFGTGPGREHTAQPS